MSDGLVLDTLGCYLLQEQALQEGRQGRSRRGLPFAKHRDASGRLIAAEAERVPPMMPPSKTLVFPLHLGGLVVHLQLQNVRS